MTLLLTQMAIVLLITVACGWLALKVGQARVIGEIIGGILVGPSVFGRFAPHLSASLFPPSSLGPFETLSTVGLVLFLFLIGMELDYEHLARQRATAVMASGMSILLPFGMAALLAHSLRIRFAPHGIGSIPCPSLTCRRLWTLPGRRRPWVKCRSAASSCMTRPNGLSAGGTTADRATMIPPHMQRLLRCGKRAGHWGTGVFWIARSM